ncbi:MAG: hypothetical protein U0Q18_25355 [Bryobacteraceae bacterium]
MSDNGWLWLLAGGVLVYLLMRHQQTSVTVDRTLVINRRGLPYSASGLYDQNGNPMPPLTSGWDVNGNYVMS